MFHLKQHLEAGMSNFEQAIEYVIKNEGGYSNDIHDSGKETQFGISSSSGYLEAAIKKGLLPECTTIKSLTVEQAKIIYKHFFWDHLKLDNVINQSIATKILDTCVNVGNTWGIKLLQRAIRAATGVKLDEDGICGNATFEAIRQSLSSNLLSAYKSECAGYYRSIVARKPDQDVFIRGWLNRAYGNL